MNYEEILNSLTKHIKQEKQSVTADLPVSLLGHPVPPIALQLIPHLGAAACFMFYEILIKAILGTDEEYAQALVDWLDGRKATVHVRDTLCDPFRHLFQREIDYSNAWIQLDSAILKCRDFVRRY